MEISEQLDYVVRIERVQYHRQRYRYRCQCAVESSPTGTGTETESTGTHPQPEQAGELPTLVIPEASEASAPSTPGIGDPREANSADPADRSRSFTAPRPLSVIPRGIFSINFLVQVLAWKYAWGLPLHRLRQQWASQGAAISAGSLVGALRALGPVLEPLYDAIKTVNRSEKRWHADETHWKVFVHHPDKSGYRWWLWVFSGARSTVFLLSPTRSAQVPKGHLQPSPNDDAEPTWFQKILLTDFYSGYRAMLAGLIHAWCWAHIRRRFFAAWKSSPGLADWGQAWLDRIRDLYHLYDVRARAPIGSAAWDEADQALRTWVKSAQTTWTQELAQPSLTEPARKILATVQRQWEGLTQFLDYPEIPLDNNEAERLLRTPVVGRKNYYGSRSEWSGHLAAMVWTLWVTAEQNGRNPVTYLTEYFTAYAQNGNRPLSPERLQEFLPKQPDADTG
ncbi:MAG: IS66 family transposase [Thermaerobacter sp.]|nr:IS66 family transposase [Thermaerobacter sp.]